MLAHITKHSSAFAAPWTRLWCLCVLACIIALPTLAQAPSADIRTSRSEQYVRLSFSWAQPTSMRVTDTDTSVIARFSTPVPQSVTGAAAQLAPYVRSIARSSDGKTITLTLNDRHKVRHFTSGKNTGIDVMAALKPPRNKPKPAPPALAQIKPRSDSVLTTKTPPRTTTSKQSAPSNVAALTTNPTGATSATTSTPTPTSPTTGAAAPTPKAQTPPRQAPVQARENGAPAPAPEAAQQTNETPPSPRTPSAPQRQPETVDAAKTGELRIGVVPNEKGPILQFPFPSRTAIAAFSRKNDIWMIIGQRMAIDMERLRGILPSSLTNVQRYHYPAYTVLRFTSRDAVYPHVTGSRDNYQLEMQLRPRPATPNTDIAITPGVEQSEPFILFSVFDAAKPVSFYDPTIGDRWVVVPVFEVGRGIETERNFPGLRILQTSQGIAISTDDDTVRMRRTRAGMKLSRKGGIALSKHLPYLPGQKQVDGLQDAARDVVIAKNRYHAPGTQMIGARRDLMQRLVRAINPESRAHILQRLAGLYVANGYGPEASTILTELRRLYRTHYDTEKLAIMHAAAAFLAGRNNEAAQYLQDEAIQSSNEAAMWKEAFGLFETIAPGSEINAQEPLKQSLRDIGLELQPSHANRVFDYLGYESSILRHYPAPLRQRLALIAADRYIKNEQTNDAIAVFDRLDEAGILEPIQPYAEYLFGKIAADKDSTDTAINIWSDLVARDEDRYVTARAEFALITLKYAKGITNLEDTIKALEGLRLDWRGDALERELLSYLGDRHLDAGHYDRAMYSWKELLNAFPRHPQNLRIRQRMAALFEELFTEGLADTMEPLRSLALFYEFRNLTPIGERGNLMVQKLAERLASVDLLDRAIELLDHQVRKRVSGEERARVGAQLALLHIMNDQPKEALSVLERSNYGDANHTLRKLRLQLNAQALADDGRPMDAIGILRDDRSPKGRQLALDILWQMQDWPNVIRYAEDMLALRKNLTAPLTPEESETLIQLALAYSFERDYAQLSYLRDFYLNLIPEDNPYRGTFDYLTNDTSPLDTEDVALLSNQISRTRSFLRDLSEQVSRGNLSKTAN
jgi:hypothetical protein